MHARVMCTERCQAQSLASIQILTLLGDEKRENPEERVSMEPFVSFQLQRRIKDLCPQLLTDLCYYKIVSSLFPILYYSPQLFYPLDSCRPSFSCKQHTTHTHTESRTVLHTHCTFVQSLLLLICSYPTQLKREPPSRPIPPHSKSIKIQNGKKKKIMMITDLLFLGPECDRMRGRFQGETTAFRSFATSSQTRRSSCPGPIRKGRRSQSRNASPTAALRWLNK